MRAAYAWADRSTCLRRAVGCVLLDARGRTLSTGHNGVAAGMPHCNEVGYANDDPAKDDGPTFSSPQVLHRREVYRNACAAASAPSGASIDGCEAVHAEQNAIAFCRAVEDVDTAYVTTSPCMPCVKLLLNTGCRRIVFAEPYVDQSAKALWEKTGREWLHLEGFVR